MVWRVCSRSNPLFWAQKKVDCLAANPPYALPWEAQVEGEGALVGGIFIGDVVAKRVGVVPPPHFLPSGVSDAARTVEVVALDVVHLGCGDGYPC
jgi:hypothetical protein